MAFLKKENKLGGERVRFRDKEFQIKFVRTRKKNGKFKTQALIVRGEKQYHGNNKGLLHKIVNLKYHVNGDKPSIIKNIDNMKPSSVKGYIGKYTAKGTYKAAKHSINAAVNTALAAETVGLKTVDTARHEIRRKVQQKYVSEAVDDYHKGALAYLRVGKDALKGVKRHYKLKKQHRLEKDKFKLKKSEKRSFKETYKLKKPDIKTNIKTNKNKFQQRLQSFNNVKKANPNYNIRKALIIRRKQKYKKTHAELKLDMDRLAHKYRAAKKTVKNQRKISKYSKPGLIALKPAEYTSKRMTASAWQKSVNADENNDMMRVVDSAKRRVVTPVLNQMSRSERLRRKQKKRDKLQDKNSKKNTKLNKREQKLKKKHANKSGSRKQAEKKTKKTVAEKVKSLLLVPVKLVIKMFNLCLHIIFSGFTVVVLLILLIFLFIMMIFSSIMSGGSFILGTYNAQDYDLSEAEKYYTQLAYSYNERIKKVGTKDWNAALKSLGVDTSGYSDDPDTFVWGKSKIFNYNAAYDFDPYLLWSFLCAYYYDFSKENGDVKYWHFDDSTKALLAEIFVSEYAFEHFYDNSSAWEEYSKYTYDGKYHHTMGGGYDGSHAYVDFKLVPNTLKGFANGKRVYFNIDNGEILDYSKKYKATGWYFKDQRHLVTDPSGNKINPFYTYDENAYKTAKSGGYGKYHLIKYTQNGMPKSMRLWFPKDDYTLKLPDGRDFSDTFCVIAAPSDVLITKYAPYSTDGLYFIYNYQQAHPKVDLIKDYWDRAGYITVCKKTGKDIDGYDGYGFCSFYQKYYWKKNCQLYYNVKQKKTFDSVLSDKLKSMSNANERIAYYNLLTGKDGSKLYGNHQTLHNVVSDSITQYTKNGKILNGYGYDMQGWNTTHCAVNGLHEGIDIQYPKNSKIYAPFDCEIKSYDKDKHTVVLRKNSVEYWYDGSGGTKRDTEVNINNVSLIGTFKANDTLKDGEYFAVSTGDKYCGGLKNSLPYDYVHVKVQIDIDGYGWGFIDPRLVLY